MRMTEHARRKRRRSCEWCGDLLVDWVEKMGAAMGVKKVRHRIDMRFCSPSCRQQSYSARKYRIWDIDGEHLTGQELVDRGWTLYSERGDPARKHARRVVGAVPPGQEPHPLAEIRPYRRRRPPDDSG